MAIVKAASRRASTRHSDDSTCLRTIAEHRRSSTPLDSRRMTLFRTSAGRGGYRHSAESRTHQGDFRRVTAFSPGIATPALDEYNVASANIGTTARRRSIGGSPYDVNAIVAGTAAPGTRFRLPGYHDGNAGRADR